MASGAAAWAGNTALALGTLSISILYGCLLAVLALVAALSKKKYRREAALEALKVLVGHRSLDDTPAPERSPAKEDPS